MRIDFALRQGYRGKRFGHIPHWSATIDGIIFAGFAVENQWKLSGDRELEK
jgi:hypothetical protein